MAIIFRNEKLFCTKCGTYGNINFPIEINEMSKKTKEFENTHADCKQTWTEPTPDMTKSIQERAEWWLINGETGASSKAMLNCMLGNVYRVDYPRDPDDFKRCYKLLEVIPEWKSQLDRLKSMSTAWAKLVDNWDKLTQMYEQNVRENWENYEKIGMYEFMESLLKN